MGSISRFRRNVGLLSSMSRGEFGMQRTDQCRVSIGGVLTGVYNIHYNIVKRVPRLA
jgi:hypothetical protein